jgi:hypothetical protein
VSDGYTHSSPGTLAREMTEPSAPGGRATAEASTHVRSTLGLAVRSTPSTSSADLVVAPEPEKPQDARSQQSAQLLALADLMEGWAAALPRWDSQVTEPWFVFLERAYQAETSLAERLRQLPTCRLVMCQVREQVSLALAGISVSSDQGLAAACRTWAQKARAQSNS